MRERIPDGVVPAPDPRDAVRRFLASTLELARVRPDAAPAERLLAWHRRLAASVGVVPRDPRSHRELLDGALRLQRIVRGLPDPVLVSPPLAPRARAAPGPLRVTYPSPA